MILRILSVFLSFALLCPGASAQADKKQFVANYTDIESVNPQITHSQCELIYGEPIHYALVDGKAIYAPNKNLEIIDYERLQNSSLDKDHQVFLGKQRVQLRLNKRVHTAENLIYFVLDKNTHTITGGWYSPGYCKGRLTGKELDTDD